MNQVVDKLHEVSVLGEKRIAVLGYNVRIKGRNIKRRTTILKHSRFLHNLSVTAKIPEPEVAKADGEAEEGENGEENEWYWTIPHHQNVVVGKAIRRKNFYKRSLLI